MKGSLAVSLLLAFLVITGNADDEKIVANYKEMIRLREKAIQIVKTQEGVDPGILESLEMQLLKTKGGLAAELDDIPAQIKHLQDSIKILKKTRDRFKAISDGDETMVSMEIGLDIGVLQLENQLLRLQRRSKQVSKPQ